MRKWLVSYAVIWALLVALTPAHASPSSAGAGKFAGAGSSCTTPLDTGIAAASNAYSFRLALAAYAGSAVQLQRSDSATVDVGFVNSCDFDTATAASFCNATTCRIKTWYDQKGALNCTQSTFANMPLYVASNINSKPGMSTEGGAGWFICGTTSDLQLTGNFSVVAVTNSDGAADGNLLAAVQSGSPFNGYQMGNGIGAQFNTGIYTDGGGSQNCGLVNEDNSVHLIGFVRSSTTVTCRLDGSTATLTGSSNVASGFAPVMLAATSSGSLHMSALVEEVIIWNSTAISSGDYGTYRTTAENYYGAP